MEPSNLSCLADAVVKQTGSQRLLVEQLSERYAFKAATPNEGHLLTAALLGEGALNSVVTLNFDLALSTAIGQLGVGGLVAIIDGPDDLPKQQAVNLYYLHRNATADPEEWILQTAALKSAWKEHWENIIAVKALAAPVVVFAGLGSPAYVLIESAKLIKNAIPNGSKAYQVDPGEPEASEFFGALGLEWPAYIREPWCAFMADLSERVVLEQSAALETAAAAMIQRDGLVQEDTASLLKRLREIGLLQLGRLRASWLLEAKPYEPDRPLSRELIADLLLAAAMVARVTGSTAVPFEDGTVEFRRGDRTVSSHVFASGRGSRGRIAIERELSVRWRRFRGRGTPPVGAVVAGTRDRRGGVVSAPRDVLLGEASESIVVGGLALPLHYVDALRRDEARCNGVAP